MGKKKVLFPHSVYFPISQNAIVDKTFSLMLDVKSIKVAARFTLKQYCEDHCALQWKTFFFK